MIARLRDLHQTHDLHEDSPRRQAGCSDMLVYTIPYLANVPSAYHLFKALPWSWQKFRNIDRHCGGGNGGRV
jgi:hypothetical protein